MKTIIVLGGLAWVALALFHALSAGIRQNMIKKYFVGEKERKSLSGDFGLLAIQYAIAGTAIFILHIVVTGTPWFPGKIPPNFWWVMAAFILFNAFAAKLGLKALKGTDASAAILMVCLTSGLMVLADGIWFKHWPTLLGWIGIGMITGTFFVIKVLERKPGEKKETYSWKLLGTSFLSLAIYNFITPATNKGCVLMTSATFTSYFAHLGIAVVLFIAAILTKEKGQALTLLSHRSEEEKGSLMIVFLAISLPMAFSNFLASWSFQLGAVIPGVYMLKRVLPASVGYWRKKQRFGKIGTLLAIVGAVLMAISSPPPKEGEISE